MRESMNRCPPAGSNRLIPLPSPIAIRTMAREIAVESKRSSPSSWRPRLTSVSVTVRALREIHSVATMTPPASSNSQVPEGTFPARAPIVTVSGSEVACAAW